MKKNLLLITLLFVAVISACKKDKAPVDEDKVPTEGTRLDKIKDSVFLYAKESYLWYDALPSYGSFKPRGFTGSTELAALQKEVDAISQFKINPGTNKPYEYVDGSGGESKYSFIDDGSTSGELGGQAGNFGFDVRYSIDDDLYVKSVYLGSPADGADMKRGYKIISINNRTALSPTEANISFLVDALYYKNTIKLGLEKPDGSTFTATVNVAEYTINPVLAYKVITIGAKKIGYMVFDTFTALANAKPKLDEAFALFGSESVTDVVMDLRYNGGGYTETADYICDRLVPSGKNGSVMYTYYFNDKLQAGKFPLIDKAVFGGQLTSGSFKPENNEEHFEKKGSLNLNKVVFIVTGSSASASELVINNLTPHLDVKLVGETSYGKPVGFFSIPIDKYELYIPQFETKNSSGESDYYEGMEPGSPGFPGKYTFDDVAKDFGEVDEDCLQQALSYITTGGFLAINNSKRNASVRSPMEIRNLGIKLSKPRFKGMIREKMKLN